MTEIGIRQLPIKYSDPTIQRFIVLSDIHADIDSLIVALRDCAKVICKRRDLEPFNNDKCDEDLYRFLNIDISVDDNDYREDLGYMWCGGKMRTFVVVIGDMIDGIRNAVDSLTTDHYYPQVEIKIIRFINEINRQAYIHNGSRIIKILGNHEHANIVKITKPDYYDIYTFKNDRDNDLIGKPYYRGISRKEIFHPQNIGYNLLKQDGIYACIVINRNIFVHGSLSTDEMFNIDRMDQLNNILNTNSPEEIVSELTWRKSYDGNKGIMWIRSDSGDDKVHNMLKSKKQHRYCKQIRNKMRTFLGQDGVKKYRLFVGHCIQSYSTMLNGMNTTYKTIQTASDPKIVEYTTLPTKTGFATPLDKFVFGITMECQKSDDSHSIYRVDVGASRAFVQPAVSLPQDTCLADDTKCDEIDRTIMRSDEKQKKIYLHNQNKLMFSTTPQVLEILNNKYIRIIRSTMRNTRIHQIKRAYENYVTGHRIKVLNIDSPEMENKDSEHRIEDLILDKEYSLDEDPRMPGHGSISDTVDVADEADEADEAYESDTMTGGNEMYRRKYLKYKHKYLNLKHNNNITKK